MKDWLRRWWLYLLFWASVFLGMAVTIACIDGSKIHNGNITCEGLGRSESGGFELRGPITGLFADEWKCDCSCDCNVPFGLECTLTSTSVR